MKIGKIEFENTQLVLQDDFSGTTIVLSDLTDKVKRLEAENERLRGWLEFYGIEVLPDGSTQFKLKTMDKWRKAQHDIEVATLRQENEQLRIAVVGKGLFK